MNSEAQFQKIYQEQYSKVIRLCLGYVSGDEEMAKDLTHEVFIKVWQNLKHFRNQSKISTWIYRIAVNTCLQQLRNNRVIKLKGDFIAETDIDEVEKEQKFFSMYRCINSLSPENKSIILLELEGVPQIEMSLIIGISHQAIRTRISRIKEQLSKCVKNERI